jgi:hypothetical protein
MMGAGGLANQACWDCGLTGHRRGDDVCKEKGACGGNSCPPFLKRLKAEGKDVMPRAGGGDSRKGGGTKRKGVCNFYARTKSCRFGDKCKFEHEGNGGGAAMMSKKAKKKAKKEIIESAMQGGREGKGCGGIQRRGKAEGWKR